MVDADGTIWKFVTNKLDKELSSTDAFNWTGKYQSEISRTPSTVYCSQCHHYLNNILLIRKEQTRNNFQARMYFILYFFKLEKQYKL